MVGDRIQWKTKYGRGSNRLLKSILAFWIDADHDDDDEDSEGKISAVKEIFKSLDLEKHTIDMMKDYYTRALKHLEAIESNNKAPLIDFSDKLMERIS